MTLVQTGRSPTRRAIRRLAGPALLGLLGCAVSAWLGLARYARGMSGTYDLGIFTQAAQGWATGQGPVSAIKGGGSLFGDHFSPVTVLFGLAYAVWSDPRSLILVQALALGVAAAMVLGHARSILAHATAWWVGVVTALGLPFMSASLADVHETALGAPFVVGLAVAVRSGSLRAALAWGVLVLTVKEDLGLMVVAAGAAWWLARPRPDGARDMRGALALAGVGVVGALVAWGVVAAVGTGGANPYVQFLAPGGLSGLVRRLVPSLLFLAACGGRWRDPLVLLAIPTLGWRLVSSVPHHWSALFHYDVPLACVAAVVLVAALAHHRPRGSRAVAVLLSAVVLGWGLFRIAQATPWRAAAFSTPAHAVQVKAAVAGLPAGEPVIADMGLGTYLVDHHPVGMLTVTDPSGTLALTPPARARYVVVLPDARNFSGSACAKRGLVGRSRIVAVVGDVVLLDLGAVRVPDMPRCTGDPP